MDILWFLRPVLKIKLESELKFLKISRMIMSEIEETIFFNRIQG